MLLGYSACTICEAALASTGPTYAHTLAITWPKTRDPRSDRPMRRVSVTACLSFFDDVVTHDLASTLSETNACTLSASCSDSSDGLRLHARTN